MKKNMRERLQREFLATFGVIGIEKACTHLGISRFTPYKWRNDPDFQARYNEQLARYQCRWEPMSDADYEQAAATMRIVPERDLIRSMRNCERREARWHRP